MRIKFVLGSVPFFKILTHISEYVYTVYKYYYIINSTLRIHVQGIINHVYSGILFKHFSAFFLISETKLSFKQFDKIFKIPLG